MAPTCLAYRAGVHADEARRVLDVGERADPDELRAAYRALLRSTHPDVNAARDANERTARLTAAYRVLVTAATSEGRARADSDARHGSAARPGGHTSERRPERISVVAVDDQTVGITVPPDEALLWLLEAAHRLGEVSYLDRGSGLLEVVVEFIDQPTSSVVMSLQGRATGITEVLCTVEPLSGGDAPPAAAVARLVCDTLTEVVLDASVE